MSILAIDKKGSERNMLLTAFRYLCLAVFVAVFGGVYEYFGHDIISFKMIFAFMYPLVLGSFVMLLGTIRKKGYMFGWFTRSMYNCGIFTLTIGSLYEGAMEIYGTSHHLSIIYYIVGGVLVAGAFILKWVDGHRISKEIATYYEFSDFGPADFTIGEMLTMQRKLQDQYKDKWEAICPENGKNKLLWMMGEVGEVADIVKKNGDINAVKDSELRAHLVEEMADVLMYYNDVLLCYGIGEKELKDSYQSKFEKNMKRWK